MDSTGHFWSEIWRFVKTAISEIHRAINNLAPAYERYAYDSLNQLTSASYGGDTYTYTYDNGGNLLSVKKNGTETKSYGYTDTNWKDKLTSYNNQQITYNVQYNSGLRKLEL